MYPMQEIILSPKAALPIYEQLTEQLKYRVEAGVWGPGTRLPTVRDFAQSLRVNYHTVRTAYQQLERDGYIVTTPGRGTFVVDVPPRLFAGQSGNIIDLIDETLIAAEASGISAEVFARAASVRTQLFTRPKNDIRLLFAECNQSDLEYHARTIQLYTNIFPEVFLLEELHGCGSAFFTQFDLVLTTLSHVAELQELLGTEQRALGLMVEPSYQDVLAELAPLPANTPVGLICITQQYAKRMERMLLGVGLLHLRFLTVGVDQPGELAHVFANSDHLYVSRLGLNVYHECWPLKKPVHPYITHLDVVGLRMLRREIARVRAAQSAGDAK